jgi:hypothetical protein
MRTFIIALLLFISAPSFAEELPAIGDTFTHEGSYLATVPWDMTSEEPFQLKRADAYCEIGPGREYVVKYIQTVDEITAIAMELTNDPQDVDEGAPPQCQKGQFFLKFFRITNETTETE